MDLHTRDRVRLPTETVLPVFHPTLQPHKDVWSAAKYPSATRNVPWSSTVSPWASGVMVCSQSAVASEACAPDISPNDPRISVEVFNTSRPRIRAVVLELTL